MCVQFFHVVSIDMPAGVGAPPLNTKNRVQGGATTNCVRREISISVATNGPWPYLVNRFSTFLLHGLYIWTLHLENDNVTGPKICIF